jgi:hypothetical protein
MQDPPATGFKDRSSRLTLFGALSILAGGGCLLLGLLHVALLLGAGRHLGVQVDARAHLSGALLYALLGGAFIWIGGGSVRKRRWARPLMLTLAWTWLLGGLSVLLLLPGLVDIALGTAVANATPPDPSVVGLAKIVLMLVAGFVGVVVPASFVWVYNDRHLRLTCEAHDPEPDWTQSCPPSVLGLSIGLAACGGVALLMTLRPAVPLFGWLATGWPAVLSLLVGAGACLWLARETFALRASGWWITTVFLVLVGVSTWLTLVRVQPDELFRAMGYPEDSLPSGDSTFGHVATWLTVVFTLLTVAYMVGIRKHFTAGPAAGVSRPD